MNSKWTTLPPNEPGWYWHVSKSGSPQQARRYGRPWVERVVMSANYGLVMADCPTTLTFAADDMWIGPILEPVAPS